MTTTLIFRDDWYAEATEARVLAVTERGAIVLDRTVFYPTGGGQPGDAGTIARPDGSTIAIATAVWDDPAKTIVAHVPARARHCRRWARRSSPASTGGCAGRGCGCIRRCTCCRSPSPTL